MRLLNELVEVVKQIDAISKRDEVNFEGAKFTYVFDELLSYYDQATKEVCGKNMEEFAQRLLKAFRDIIAVKEADLRIRTKKIRSPR